MILSKLYLLKEILVERLQNLIMWNEVGIFFPGDKFPKDTVDEAEIKHGYFYIVWYNKRRADNPHPCHYKRIPLTIDEINAVIKRQREKLRTESNKL